MDAATVVFTVVLVFEFVYVGRVSVEGSVESVRILVRESVRDEQLEFVGGVGEGADKRSKIAWSKRMGSLLSVAGSSAFACQFGCWSTVWMWVAFMFSSGRRLWYFFRTSGACRWSAGSHVLSLFG